MAGDTRKVTLVLTGQNRQLLAALEEAGLVADQTSKTMGDKMDAASTRVGGAFSKIGQSIESFTGIPVAGAMDKLGGKFEEADTKGQKFSQGMQTLGGAALLGVAAAAGVVAYSSIQMADQFDVAQTQLQVAVANSGNSFLKVKPLIDQANGSMANLGYNSTDVAAALTVLTTATGNPTKAIGDLTTAADLARFKHESLSDASSQLAKVLGGNTRILTQMGINIDVGNGKMKAIDAASQALAKAQGNLQTVQGEVASGALTGAKAQAALATAHDNVSTASQNLAKDQGAVSAVLDAIRGKTEGAAKAYGTTLAGQMAVARAQIHNVMTEIGDKLIPVIASAAKWVGNLIVWFDKHRAAAAALGIALGVVLVAAIGLYMVSVASAAVATVAAASLVDVALAGIPILIGLLIAAAVWLAANWSRVWTDIKNWVKDAVDWIKDHLLLVAAAGGPIGMLVAAVVWLGSNWSSIWGGIQTAVSYAWAVIKPIFDAITGAVKDVTGGISSVFHMATSATGVGGKALSFVTGGLLAEGGPATAGTPYIVGEQGPELFIPRSSGTVIPNKTAFGQSSHTVSTPSVAAGNTINVKVNSNADPMQIASAIGWALRTKVAA